MPTEPKGPDAAQFSEFGAFMVAQQAVGSQDQSLCSVQGCSQPAAVQCCDCRTQEGRLLCAQHDAERHGSAHQHCRFGLLHGCKQPLRPTQQYCPSSHELQDVVLCFDIKPVRQCQKCGSHDWQLNSAATQQGTPQAKPRQLIIYTTKGELSPALFTDQDVFCKRWPACVVDACVLNCFRDPILVLIVRNSQVGTAAGRPSH